MFRIILFAFIVLLLTAIEAQNWTKLKYDGETATWLYVKGKDIWVVTYNGKLYHWEGGLYPHGSWVDRSIKVNGQLVKAIRVTQTYVNEVAWAISENKEVYLYDTANVNPRQIWMKVQGQLLDEIAGYDKQYAYGIKVDLRGGCEFFEIKDKQFIKLDHPTPSVACHSVAVSSFNVPYVTSNDAVYNLTKNGVWMKMFNLPTYPIDSANKKQMDVFSPSVIVSCSSALGNSFLGDEVYKYNSDVGWIVVDKLKPNVNPRLQGGLAIYASVSSDTIYAINNAGDLFSIPY